MPLDSKESADAWRGMGAKKREAMQSGSNSDGPFRPEEASDPVDPTISAEDSPRGAYERQRKIERAAFNLASSSIKKGMPDAGRLVAIHAQAANNLIKAREEVLKLAERERTLVSGDWVRKVMTDHDGAIATILKAMPKSLAPRIAPHDPEHAEQELERWVQETALATLSKTDPWK